MQIYLALLLCSVAAAAQDMGEEAPLTKCDCLAAHPLDRNAVASGVIWDNLRSDLAVAACEQAVARHPRSVRLRFQLGRALDKDGKFGRAAGHYRSAADLGYGMALHNLGSLHHNGKGFKRDDDAASVLYGKAVRAGEPAGHSGLADIYRYGREERNYAKAREHLELAAEGGSFFAMAVLGGMHMKGQGARRNLAQAGRLFRQAADRGYGGGWYLLAQLAKETGRPGQFVMDYLEIASSQGNRSGLLALGEHHAMRGNVVLSESLVSEALRGKTTAGLVEITREVMRWPEPARNRLCSHMAKSRPTSVDSICESPYGIMALLTEEHRKPVVGIMSYEVSRECLLGS
ncbi:MAG: tetratricopeptide repeat protein [Pseudomonadota bacterium]